MLLPHRVRYALLAMQNLARGGGERKSAHAVAAEEGLPPRYLDAILAELREAGLVVSMRGKHGGFRLARPPARISLIEVLQAMHAELAPLACLRAAAERCEGCASTQACPLRALFQPAYARYLAMLEATSLADPPGRGAPAGGTLRPRGSSIWAEPIPAGPDPRPSPDAPAGDDRG